MSDQTNAFGSLPIIFTIAPNSKGVVNQNRQNYFNSLWINPTGGTGWDPGASSGPGNPNPGNYYFANQGLQPQVNGTPIKLTQTADASFGASSLIPWNNPAGVNPGNGTAEGTALGNGPNYRSYKKLKSAIRTWLASPDRNIGYAAGQNNPAGLTSTWFTGGRFNLGTSSAAAATGSDTPKNLRSGNNAYFYLEPFIGTQDDNSYASENFVDMSYIDSFGGGVDLIPWFYNTTTKQLQTSTNPGFAPVLSIQATANPAVAKRAFSGTTTNSAIRWLSANIQPMNLTSGSAPFAFTPKSVGTQYVRMNQPEYAKTLVYDTTLPKSGKYYYHNFQKYLYDIQTQTSGGRTPWKSNVKATPWLMTPTNNGSGFGWQIYNVVFNDFNSGTSTGATIDLYIAQPDDISNYQNGGIVNANACKLTLFWDSHNSKWESGVNVLSDQGNGIYGANPGFMATTYDAQGVAEAGAQYTDDLGVANNQTWLVGDFLAALNYGMILGTFPARYTDSNGNQYQKGALIPPQLWLTETSGALGDNMFVKNGWSFAAIQNDPNHYNQYAYGISQVATNDYGWAYTDRMQPSVGVTPNPYTYDAITTPFIYSTAASPIGPGGGAFSNADQVNAGDTTITFSTADATAIQALLASATGNGLNLYLGGQAPTLPNGSDAFYVQSVDSGTGVVTLAGGPGGDGTIVDGMGASAEVNFSPAEASVGYTQNVLYFSAADLTRYGVQEGMLVSGQSEIPAGTTVVDIVTGVPGYAGTSAVTLSQDFTLLDADANIPYSFADTSTTNPFVFLEARIRPPARYPLSGSMSSSRSQARLRSAVPLSPASLDLYPGQAERSLSSSGGRGVFAEQTAFGLGEAGPFDPLLAASFSPFAV